MRQYFLKKKFMIMKLINSKKKESTKKLLKELDRKPKLKEKIKIYKFSEITIIYLRYIDNNYKTDSLLCKEN
jgi:hypothetical protein